MAYNNDSSSRIQYDLNGPDGGRRSTVDVGSGDQGPVSSSCDREPQCRSRSVVVRVHASQVKLRARRGEVEGKSRASDFTLREELKSSERQGKHKYDVTSGEG